MMRIIILLSLILATSSFLLPSFSLRIITGLKSTTENGEIPGPEVVGDLTVEEKGESRLTTLPWVKRGRYFIHSHPRSSERCGIYFRGIIDRLVLSPLPKHLSPFTALHNSSITFNLHHATPNLTPPPQTPQNSNPPPKVPPT